jgi:hypothetical protein
MGWSRIVVHWRIYSRMTCPSSFTRLHPPQQQCTLSFRDAYYDHPMRNQLGWKTKRLETDSTADTAKQPWPKKKNKGSGCTVEVPELPLEYKFSRTGSSAAHLNESCGNAQSPGIFWSREASNVTITTILCP